MRTVARGFLRVFAFAAWIALAWGGALADDELRRADRAFNAGRFEEAESRYRALFDVARANGDELLAAELLNNIAASASERGSYNELLQISRGADAIKRRAAGRSAAAGSPRDNNLLMHGGFESGLVPPWGGGQYEAGLDTTRQARGIWWNSGGARGHVKIDTDIRLEGSRSLRITMHSTPAPHVFVTTSQRISRLRPNSVYRISLMYTGRSYKGGATIAHDAGWTDRRGLPAVEMPLQWRRFTRTINVGPSTYIDFRIILEQPGTLWIDDVRVEAVPPGEGEPLQEASALFGRGLWTEALERIEAMERGARTQNGLLNEAKALRGRIALARGDYTTAERDFRALSVARYRTADLELGRLKSLLGDDGGAVAHFESALRDVRGDQATEALIARELAWSRLRLAEGAAEARDRTELLEAAGKWFDQSHLVMRHIGDAYGAARALEGLAAVSAARGRYDTALAQLRSAANIAAILQDPLLDSDLRLQTAEFGLARGDIEGAVAEAQRALAAKMQLGDAIGAARAHAAIARGLSASGRWSDARASYERAVIALENRFDGLARMPPDLLRAFADRFRRLHLDHVAAAFEEAAGSATAASQVPDRAFRSAQWASLSAAGLAMARMGERYASDDPELADLIRRKQENIARQAVAERDLLDARSAPQARSHLFDLEAARDRFTALQDKLRKIETELRGKYPAAADFAAPKALGIDDVQRLLQPEEVLIKILVDDAATFVWAVTSQDARWARVAAPARVIDEQVRRLRCGLDRDGEWTWSEQKQSWIARKPHCAALHDGSQGQDDPPPFPARTAHELYRLLFDKIEGFIGQKQMLVVASAPLARLPLQVLVTARRDEAVISPPERLAELTWLIRRQPVTVLPSVASLQAVRRYAKISHAKRSFVGFGNPLLDGDKSDPWQARGSGSGKGSPGLRQRGWRPNGVVAWTASRMQSPLLGLGV